MESAVIPLLSIAQRLSSPVTMCPPLSSGTFLWPGRLLKQKASCVLEAAFTLTIAISFLYGGTVDRADDKSKPDDDPGIDR